MTDLLEETCLIENMANYGFCKLNSSMHNDPFMLHFENNVNSYKTCNMQFHSKKEGKNYYEFTAMFRRQLINFCKENQNIQYDDILQNLKKCFFKAK